MRKQSLALLALMLVSSGAFAQQTQTNTGTISVGYVSCPVGQSNVFLYQTVTKFDVLASPRCGERVDVLEHVDVLGGYLRVRTADSKEGFVPQDEITSIAPAKSKIAIVEPPPVPVPAAQSSPLAGALSHGKSNFAYEIPRVEAFGGYSYMSADWETMANRSGLHGFTGSAGVNVFPWLGFDGGLSENFQSYCIGAAGLNCTILNILGGPKVSVRPLSNITAFGHGLVGLSSLTMGVSGASLSFRDMAYGFGGGVDYAVTDRFSIRVGQVDYIRSEYLKDLGGSHENNIRISGGIVFRIGRVVEE
jgi:opacity protein-like surface antigen